jgi:transposase
MAYDKKYKIQAIKYHEEGNSRRKTAKTFGISPNTLNTWINQYRTKGEFTVKARVYSHKISEQNMLAYLEDNPDAYQSEMSEYFKTSQSTIHRTLKRHKITRKKR